MLVDKLISMNILDEIAKNNKLIPASSKEIIEVERKINLKLPKFYTDFLKLAGNGLTPFWQGSDYEVNKLADLQTASKELLVENGQKAEENMFCFWMHQGYQFCFFTIESNFSIYYYNECINAGIGKIANSFDDFLSNFPENLESKQDASLA